MNRAFTLIELLIVVAIIAILAAIAVPNMLEAQTRSKVARMRADLRTLATALEAYRVDNSQYPNLPPIVYIPVIGLGTPYGERLLPLTTPVTYLTTLPRDPFNPGTDPFSAHGNTFLAYGETRGASGAFNPDWLAAYAAAASLPNPDGIMWVGFSYGPLGDPLGSFTSSPTNDIVYMDTPYDPTNGTISPGIIVRVGPE